MSRVISIRGCRCQTEHFNCAQGDLCPLREPVKAEACTFDHEPSRRALRIFLAVVAAVLIAAGLLVRSGLAQAESPTFTVLVGQP